MKYTYNPSSHQTESLTVSYPVDIVYAAAVRAANSTGFVLKEENKILRRLLVSTKASLFSWGEIITVQIFQTDMGTNVQISSQPKTSIGSQGIGAQATAGVKSKKNIDRFITALSDNIS